MNLRDTVSFTVTSGHAGDPVNQEYDASGYTTSRSWSGGQSQADDIWGQASRYFGAGASGEVNLFIYGSRPDRVFHMIEKPILQASPSVNNAVLR